MLWLTQRVKNCLILVDLLVEFSLQSFLSHTHQEVSNQLWNSLSNGADNDLEVGIDTSADLLNEDVRTAARVLAFLRIRSVILALRIVNKVSVLVVLGHILLLRHNRCAVLLVVLIVYEHVVLL